MAITRWRTLALAGASALAMSLAACGSDDETPAEAGAVDRSAPQEESAAAADEEPTPAPVPDEPDKPAVFDPDATPLVPEHSPVEPGSHRVDDLGTPFSLIADQPLFMQLNQPSFFVLTDPASAGPGDNDIVSLRLSGLSDPAQPTAGPLE